MRLQNILIILLVIGVVLVSGCIQPAAPTEDHVDDGHAHGVDDVHEDETDEHDEDASLENDPSKKTVLIGSKIVDNMRIKVEFEPAKGMFMKMGGNWKDMNPAADEIYHLEIKLEDPYSETRISHSDVKLSIAKVGSEEVQNYDLHAMWGGSGLHYADNGKLAGDGDYVATVVANPPTFARGSSNKDLWLEAITADFKFSIKDGIITSEPDVSETSVPALPEGHEKEFHVVVGDAVFDDMGVKVELEDSATMYMLTNGNWMKMEPEEGDIHLEVKLTDNLKSSTRIPYSEVKMTLENKETGEKIEKDLHAMWGGSGLHYGANENVPPGEYTVTVDVSVPEFARGLSDKEFYMSPVQAQFDYTHGESSTPEAAVKEFTITAKQWEFSPSTITVDMGDTVKLHIASIDVTHGFGLPAFGVSERLEPGETVNIEFVADKAGTFSFSCIVSSCGAGHGGMSGQLVVN